MSYSTLFICSQLFFGLNLCMENTLIIFYSILIFVSLICFCLLICKNYTESYEKKNSDLRAELSNQKAIFSESQKELETELKIHKDFLSKAYRIEHLIKCVYHNDAYVSVVKEEDGFSVELINNGMRYVLNPDGKFVLVEMDIEYATFDSAKEAFDFYTENIKGYQEVKS